VISDNRKTPKHSPSWRHSEGQGHITCFEPWAGPSLDRCWQRIKCGSRLSFHWAWRASVNQY